MKIQILAATLMATCLLAAAPSFAQSGAAQKQPTQEGGGAPMPCGKPYNANPAGDPDCASFKQPTQEGGPSMQGPSGGAFNADPTYSPYKQPTQAGGK